MRIRFFRHHPFSNHFEGRLSLTADGDTLQAPVDSSDEDKDVA